MPKKKSFRKVRLTFKNPTTSESCPACARSVAAPWPAAYFLFLPRLKKHQIPTTAAAITRAPACQKAETRQAQQKWIHSDT